MIRTMAHSRKERIKLFLVLALAIVFVAIAYHRFAGTHGVKGEAAATKGPLSAVSVPEIEIQGQRPRLPFESKELELLRAIGRNIFQPGEGITLPSPAQTTDRAGEEPETPVSNLHLEATILGKRKLAIINGHILFSGDFLAGHKLVDIDKDSVLLQNGKRRQRLKIMNNAH